MDAMHKLNTYQIGISVLDRDGVEYGNSLMIDAVTIQHAMARVLDLVTHVYESPQGVILEEWADDERLVTGYRLIMRFTTEADMQTF